MTLNSSGPISLAGSTAGQSIAVELGQSATGTISLNDSNVRTLAGVPSGAIVMPTNFYGKANAFAFTITSNRTNLNLASYATSVGWNGSSFVTATIGSGVWIYSTSTGTPALTTGSFPGGLTIVNNGYIAGKGGNGGGTANGSAGQPGGIAISLGRSITIDNTNGSAYIGGGGGGGGGKFSVTGDYCGGGGGAGGGNGGQGNASAPGDSPGAGSTTPGSGGGNGSYSASGRGGGAGGGGGASTWSGGGGGLVFPGTGGAGGTDGSNGTGGAGGSANSAGSAGSGLYGGGGGGWGANGGPSSAGGSIGSGGKAVALNGNSVTWVSGNTARVYGAVS